MRRKVSAAAWRFPFRMTRAQWNLVSYPQRHAFVAQAQCNLLGYWRDCKHARCRRAHCCLAPHPCYWDRKLATPDAQWTKVEARCKPIRVLLAIGSRKGSEGLWLF